jgi:hypothetical protein
MRTKQSAPTLTLVPPIPEPTPNPPREKRKSAMHRFRSSRWWRSDSLSTSACGRGAVQQKPSSAASRDDIFRQRALRRLDHDHLDRRTLSIEVAATMTFADFVSSSIFFGSNARPQVFVVLCCAAAHAGDSAVALSLIRKAFSRARLSSVLMRLLRFSDPTP